MKRSIIALITVLLGILVVGGSAFALAVSEEEPAWLEATPAGTIDTPEGTFPHATLELSIFPNTSADYPGPADVANVLIEDDGVTQSEGWPFYWPSTSLRLPANTVITITLKNYDGSSTVWNPFWAKVHGTVDGTATYNGKALREIKPSDVAHTFTLHQYPQDGQDELFVSVPMLAVPNNAKNLANGYPAPQVMQFSFKTKGPGVYVWNCEDPCGNAYQNFGGVMQARGWMSGRIEVVA